MRKRKKYIPYLLIAVLSFLGLFIYINTFDPNIAVDGIFLTLSPLIPFFLLVFLSLSSLFSFIFMNTRRGIFYSIFITFYLLLLYLHMNNILFTLLLVVIAILLELYFWKRK